MEIEDDNFIVKDIMQKDTKFYRKKSKLKKH